ncbi:MAG: VanZ family protein [Ruminococcus sp.]|nr:VanZ family protein [Ruminococcus sp.]
MKKLSAGKIIFRYALLAGVCVLIFWFSSNNGENSTSQSSRVVDLICRIFFPDMDQTEPARQLALIDILSVCVRKAAHLSVYMLLGALSFAAFFPVRRKGVRMLMAVLFTFVYACTDEIHQIFVPDRTGKISDVIIDTFGGTVGAAAVLILVVVIDAARIIRENEKLKATETEKS